ASRTRHTPFPYTTLFRSVGATAAREEAGAGKGRMVVGHQHDSSDATLRTLAAFGVTHICSGVPSPKQMCVTPKAARVRSVASERSEEHTSELQSHLKLVC